MKLMLVRKNENLKSWLGRLSNFAPPPQWLIWHHRFRFEIETKATLMPDGDHVVRLCVPLRKMGQLPPLLAVQVRFPWQVTGDSE